MPKIQDILRVIDLCLTVEKKGIDPFEVDVRKALEKLKLYLPRWKLIDELLLDAEAISRIANIVKLQDEWIKYRSSSIFLDPVLVELKIKILKKERLAKSFLRSHRPIVSLEQLTSKRIAQAAKYWNELLPLEERIKEEFPSREDIRFDLEYEGFFTHEEFQKSIKKLLRELKIKGKSSYEDFVYSETFEETLKRAYLTSFLISAGIIGMEIKPLEGKIFLNPEQPEKSKVFSAPVAIDYEKWKNYERK